MNSKLRRLRNGIRNVDRLLLRASGLRSLLARSGLARRFYLPLSSAFGREAGTILAGLAAPQEGADVEGELGTDRDYYWSRRAVHRLEKGIISRPRRASFARDYVPRLVDLLLENGDRWARIDPEMVRWTGDVLVRYFDTVDVEGDAAVAEARRRFLAWNVRRPLGCTPDGSTPGPFTAGERKPAAVEFEDLRSLAVRRRSVRWFTPERVPRELLDRAIEVAGQAPSACNRQPFTFVVADEPERAAELGSLAMGTAGFSHQFPCCIAVVGEQRAFVDIRDRHVIYIDGGLASMSLLFALETLGLSACTINWPDIGERDAAIRSLLGLRRDQQTIMLIAVGYPDPDGGIPSSTKKSLAQLRRYTHG